MPLTRLYRLGPAPQRIRKGYVIAGRPDAVTALRGELNGRVAARDVVVESPGDSPRLVTLRTGWWWLHNRDSRDAARAALTEAAVTVAAAARRRGCLLLPGAVRPNGEATWQDWTTGDHHSIALLDDVEREVASNLFRSHVPEIIALTGHPGIGPAPEPLGSRRLAESGQHLAARYLASVSIRHLSLVESELRRTTGIRDLRTMDVHPLDPPGPGGDGGSLSVRCVDGQAFAGTSIAHAILLQALTMTARRLVRDGRREGNTDQRLLERRRASAILKGIDARVPTESVATRRAGRRDDGKGGRQDSGRVSLDVLALELLDTLVPELGTLEVSFAEFAPVSAWTAALTESTIPRNEAELLARTLSGADGASHEVIAGLVATPEWHAPERFLSSTPLNPARLRALGRRWEARLTEPPPGTVPRQRAARPSDRDPKGAGEKTRAPDRSPRPDGRGRREPGGRPASPSSVAERVRSLAELPEGDPAVHADLIAKLAEELPSRAAELVPWLGQRHKDLVTVARRRLRPAGERQVSCHPGQLRPGSAKVDQACQIARDNGIAMLRTTAGAADRQAVVDAAARLVAEADAPGRFVVLAVNSFKRGDEELVSVDLLVLPRKDLA
jgi:hypothetical protein